MAHHNELGREGEKYAQQYLRGRGFEILDTNWRYGKAELDIVALKNGRLHIVEVKTRTSDYFGLPQDFVNKKKIKLLVEAANAYCEAKNLDFEIQFDIVSVLMRHNRPEIDYLPNAFIWF